LFGHLGSISFPLYAVHFPLVLMARDAGYNPYCALAIAVSGATIVTYISKRPWRARSALQPVLA
jgi:peptidoglycan/LPS O-acetylase OafA/YrhL